MSQEGLDLYLVIDQDIEEDSGSESENFGDLTNTIANRKTSGPAYSEGQGQPYPPQAQYGPQQTSDKVVVVIKQQPQPALHRPNRGYTDTEKRTMNFALGMIVVTLFPCFWWALICSVPAILFAFRATSADRHDAGKFNKISMRCSGLALTAVLVETMGLIVGAWYAIVVSS